MSDPDNPQLRDDASTAPPAEAGSGSIESGHSDSPRNRDGDTRPTNRAASPRDRFENEVTRRRNSPDGEHPEEDLWAGGFSPKAMVGWWVSLGLFTILMIVATIMIEPLTWLISLAIVVLMWVVAGMNYARMRLGFHYELTSQRLIHRTGILSRRSDRIEVIDISDVSYQQGPIQRIFGVGTIHITSSDRSDPELHLLGIDKVSEVAGLIDDIRRSERHRRLLHIDSI